jgi:outer membrane protein
MVLNVVLLVAVGILYYLHFKENKDQGSQESATMLQKPLPLAHAGIVFVNSDSLLDQYEFYKNKKKDFEESQGKIKQELKSQGEKLQQEVELYQQQAIGMTDAERAKKEEQLTMKQQQLMQRKEELLSRMDEEQSKSTDELFARLGAYLKKFNKDKNFNYVLGFQKGGGILYANDSLDVTRAVIEGLNREFREGK